MTPEEQKALAHNLGFYTAAFTTLLIVLRLLGIIHCSYWVAASPALILLSIMLVLLLIYNNHDQD